MKNSRCPHCGYEVGESDQYCQQCGKGLGRALMGNPGVEGLSVGTIFFIVVGCFLTALGVVSALAPGIGSVGVAIVGAAILAGQIARILQAGAHHRQVMAEWSRRQSRP